MAVELREAARGHESPRVQFRPTAANDFSYAAFGHLSDRAGATHDLEGAIVVPDGPVRRRVSRTPREANSFDF
jgi:hypothetical protein